jgi:hypothetical protein
VNNAESGVVAYNGKLDVRPPYQREFVYKDKQREAVIDTVLKGYPLNVISWVKAIFPKYRKEQKGLNWGALYDEFKDKSLDAIKLESEIKDLMQDEDVTKKSGICEYVLTGKEKFLNIRAFTDNQKRESYERQNGICVKCNDHFELSQMEADHITPWHEGGKTIAQNCQMLCIEDNRRKSGK